MVVIAVCNVYNEGRHIRRTLDSLVGRVQHVHVFDGRYAQFPGQNYSSTDETESIVRSFPFTTWHPSPDVPYPDQLAKRTATLQVGEPGDWLLIIDGDEWLSDSIDRLPSDADVGWVQIVSGLYTGPYRTPRLIRHRPGLHYAGRHSWIYDADGYLVASHQHRTSRYVHVDLPVQLYNLRTVNGPERERQKKAFRRVRNVGELSFASEADVYRRGDILDAHPERAGSTDGRAWEVLQKPADPIHSLILPFSRPWCLDAWFASFSGWKLPERTELLVVVDSDDWSFYSQVRNRVSEHLHRLCGARIFWTQRAKVDEFGGAAPRRARILEAWHKFRAEVQGSIVLGAEDDTIPEPDAYIRLLDLMRRRGATFVQGTEVGRWTCPCIPHWRIWASGGGRRIERIESASYDQVCEVLIDGGGWYCFACKTDAWRSVPLRWTVDPPMGPDLWFVWDLTRRGHLCLGDWSIECTHLMQASSLHPAETELAKLIHRRESGGWNTSREKAVPYRRAVAPRVPTSDHQEVPGMVFVRFLTAARGNYGDVDRGTVLQLPEELAHKLEQRCIVEILAAPTPSPPPPPVTAPVPPAPEPVDLEPEAKTGFGCPDCDREFLTERGLHTHIRRAHGLAAMVQKG